MGGAPSRSTETVVTRRLSFMPTRSKILASANTFSGVGDSRTRLWASRSASSLFLRVRISAFLVALPERVVPNALVGGHDDVARPVGRRLVTEADLGRDEASVVEKNAV